MMRLVILAAGLALGTGSADARSEEPANAPAAPAAPAPAATPEQPAMTPKQVEAALVEAARKEAAAAEQAPAAATPAEPQAWKPPPAAPKAKPAAQARPSQFRPENVTPKANEHYAAQWGIDSLKVTYTSSGNLLRFSYRVLDTTRAAPLVDKKQTPMLYGPRSHALLSVPVMEKIGPLRQAMGQVVGQEYWMVFSNKRQLIKPGDRVNVTIGSFHADGLRVE